MSVRHRGDLRQMGHAHDLLSRRDGVELLPYPLCRDPGNAGIDLVKNQSPDQIVSRKNIFHGQHDPAQFTAGSDLADASQLLTGVGRHDKAHKIRAACVKPKRIVYRHKLHGKSHRGHTELFQFRNDSLLEF